MGSMIVNWGSRLGDFSAAIVVELQSFVEREREGFELCLLNWSVFLNVFSEVPTV